MSRIYTVTFNGTVTSAGGDTDWFELTPADDKPIKLRGIMISQSSEVKDAEEEGLDFSIIRMTATVTSGNGTAFTPIRMDEADALAGFTAETNGATVATTTGNTRQIVRFSWLNRNSPFDIWFPDPQFAPKAKQTEVLILRQNTSLADDMTASLTAWVEEE